MIIIRTHLHSGIYASDGGGETRTHYQYTIGPRNLLRAIEQLRKHREAMVLSYGNVGCGASWIEINGERWDDGELELIAVDDREVRPRDMLYLAPTPTEKAKEFLAGLGRRE